MRFHRLPAVFGFINRQSPSLNPSLAYFSGTSYKHSFSARHSPPHRHSLPSPIQLKELPHTDNRQNHKGSHTHYEKDERKSNKKPGIVEFGAFGINFSGANFKLGMSPKRN